MPDHYYTQTPTSQSRPALLHVELLGEHMVFHTDAGVFSRTELDPGSALLIESAGNLSGQVVDMGCGWGPIGLFLARKNPSAQFLMADVNERAVELTRRNIRENQIPNARALQSDGLAALPETFDYFISNPPIRAGKKVIYDWFAQAQRRLVPGGALMIVIRKQQGAPSALSYLKEIFGDAGVIARSKGYWILRAQKKG